MKTNLTLLESLQFQLHYFYRGFLDAWLAYPHSMVILYGSRRIRTLTLRCILLNGVIFLGSLLGYQFALKPLIRFWQRLILSHDDTNDDTVEVLASYLYHVLEFVY